MHKNISGTMFYSLLFAMGGAPTIAMVIILLQPYNPDLLYQIFIGLSVMIACVLVPIILLQNLIVFIKRHQVGLVEKLEPVAHFYLVLNIACLIFWIVYQFTH